MPVYIAFIIIVKICMLFGIHKFYNTIGMTTILQSKSPFYQIKHDIANACMIVYIGTIQSKTHCPHYTYIVTRIRHRTADTCSGRCKITWTCPRNSSEPFSMLRIFVTMSGVTNIVGSDACVAATNERSDVRWKRLLVVGLTSYLAVFAEYRRRYIDTFDKLRLCDFGLYNLYKRK